MINFLLSAPSCQMFTMLAEDERNVLAEVNKLGLEAVSRHLTQHERGAQLSKFVLDSHGRLARVLLASGPIEAVYRGLALSFALSKGQEELVEPLLNSGPINESNRSHAILTAARNHNEGLVRALLASGPINNYERGETAVCLIENGDRNVAFLLLDSGGLDQNAFASQELLRIAAENNDMELMQMLIARGILDNVGNRAEAIAGATAKNHADMVEVILQRGPIRFSDKEKISYIAAKNQNQHILGILYKYGSCSDAAERQSDSDDD